MNSSEASTGLFPQQLAHGFNWHIPFGFWTPLPAAARASVHHLLTRAACTLAVSLGIHPHARALETKCRKHDILRLGHASLYCQVGPRSFSTCSDDPATRQLCGYSAWLNKERSTSFTTFLCAASAMDAHFAVVGVNERMRTSLCLLKRMLSWSTVNWNDVRLFGGTRVNSSQHFDAVGADALPPRFFEWDSSLYRKADDRRLTEQAASNGCGGSELLAYDDGQPIHSPASSHGMGNWAGLGWGGELPRR